MDINVEFPPWPLADPCYADVRLRRFEDGDAGMAMDLARDGYVPAIGTLPAHASQGEALAWVERQRQHYVRGTGFAFSVADARSGRCLGQIGLWLRELGKGRAQAG